MIIFPTVAGIMVLGLYPQKFFPQWFIAAMVFPGFQVAELGEERQRFNDNKRIDGNIVEMYNETMIELDYKNNRILKRNYINILLKEEELGMTIPDKPTSKNQKYVTLK